MNNFTTITTGKGHFPKKGERLVDGVWVMSEPLKPARQVMTAHDRRNWLRKQAGWPVHEGVSK